MDKSPVSNEEAHSPLPWRVRYHPTYPDLCFVEGQKAPDMPYAVEILGDDYNGYGDAERKKADAEFIACACNNHYKFIQALTDSLAAWEDEEDSVKAEHAELIANLTDVLKKAKR